MTFVDIMDLDREPVFQLITLNPLDLTCVSPMLTRVVLFENGIFPRLRSAGCLSLVLTLLYL